MHKNESVTINNERHMMCLEAVWELDALAALLPIAVKGSGNSEHLAVRGIASRIKSLSELLVRGLDDNLETNANLKRTLMVTD